MSDLYLPYIIHSNEPLGLNEIATVYRERGQSQLLATCKIGERKVRGVLLLRGYQKSRTVYSEAVPLPRLINRWRATIAVLGRRTELLSRYYFLESPMKNSLFELHKKKNKGQIIMFGIIIVLSS